MSKMTSTDKYVSSLMRPPFKCIVCVCVCVVLIGVAILYSEQRAIQLKKRGQKTNLLIPTHITCAHTQHTHTHTLLAILYVYTCT